MGAIESIDPTITADTSAGAVKVDRMDSAFATGTCCCLWLSAWQQSAALPGIGHWSWPTLQQAISAPALIDESARQLANADVANEATSANAKQTVSSRADIRIDCGALARALSNRSGVRLQSLCDVRKREPDPDLG